MAGARSLNPDGEQPRWLLTWQVHSALGEKIERVFADQILAALDGDQAFTLQYLEQAPAR
jgi:hypothetical protein